MSDSLQKRFSRTQAIQYTKEGILEIPEGAEILSVDFAYFVVRSDLPRVHTLKIPRTVTRIESMRGDYSSGPYGYKKNPFSQIIVDEENEHYCSEDGVLFSKDMKELICYPCGREDTCYRIPEGVEVIKTEAFLNVETLRTVLFPQSLFCVEERAFSACEQLDFPELVRIYKKEGKDALSIPFVTEADDYQVDHRVSYWLLKEEALEPMEEQEFTEFLGKDAVAVSEYEGRMEIIKQLQTIAEDWNWKLDHEESDERLTRFMEVFYSEHLG